MGACGVESVCPADCLLPHFPWSLFTSLLTETFWNFGRIVTPLLHTHGQSPGPGGWIPGSRRAAMVSEAA